MELVEIEREMWSIAQLRRKIGIVEEQEQFVEALLREYIERNYSPAMIATVLRECRAQLCDLRGMREAAEQRVRACVEHSACNRA